MDRVDTVKARARLRRYRNGFVPEQIRRMGVRTVMLSATYLVIVATGLLSLTLPTGNTTDRPAIVALCGVATLIGTSLWLMRTRVSVQLCEVFVALNAAMVGIGIIALGKGDAVVGGLQAIYGNTYLWLSVYALTFFPRRRALAQIGFGAACYLVGVLAAGRGAGGVGQVVVQTMSSLAIAFTIERVLGVARRLASNDPLTGLPNRQVLFLRTGRAIADAHRRNRRVALLLIDLDGFKKINDTQGHDAGDIVLKEVAERLRATFRQPCTVTRLGGDEFAVLVPGLAASDEATSAAARARTALAPDIDASVGVAVGPEAGDDDLSTMLRRADRAMYDEKDRRKVLVDLAAERITVEAA